MTETEQLKRTIEMCNELDVLQKEYQEYNKWATLKLPTVEEYKEQYWQDHGPHKFFGFLSLAIVLLFIKPSLETWLLGWVSEVEFAYLLLVPIVLILTGIIYYVGFRTLYMVCVRGNFVKYAQVLKEYDDILPELNALRDDAQERVNQQIAYMERESIVPRDYWRCSGELLMLIRNKRATDLTSAINKWEDIQHQKRLEDYALDTKFAAEMSQAAAERAEANSRLAAERASKAEFASSMSLLVSLSRDD